MQQSNGTRHCPRCGEWKAADEFYAEARMIARREFACRACNRLRTAAQYKPWRDYVNAIKLRLGCTDCGYREFAEALEFDHLPGFVKVGNISKLSRAMVPFSVLDVEIAKCELVCANCHRVRTVGRAPSTTKWDLKAQRSPGPDDGGFTSDLLF